MTNLNQTNFNFKFQISLSVRPHRTIGSASRVKDLTAA